MTDDHDDSGMVALIPANPGALAIPGGIPAADLHCTLVFLGDGVSGWSPERIAALREMAQQLASSAPPIDTRVFSNSVWNADRAPNPQGEPTTPSLVYQLREQGHVLEALQQQAAGRAREVLSVDYPTQWAPYVPHIAGAYDEDDPTKLKTPGPVRLATLRLALGKDRHDYPLTGGTDGAEAFAHDGGTMTKTKTGPQRTGDTKVTKTADGKLALHWPCLVIEGMKTGDGRYIPAGALGNRGLPLPVMGQTKTGKGHDGAEVFGHITKLERVPGPQVVSKETGEPFPEGTFVWQAWGEADADTEPGKLALDGYLTGNSADLADTQTVEELADEDGKPVVELRGGKIAGTTLVPVPAFADGYVEVNGEVIERDPATEAMVSSAELAPAWRSTDPVAETAAGEPQDEDEPFRPPLRLFQQRPLRGITPLTLEPQEDGTLAVYGHVADFSRPHISFTGQRVMARPSPSQYRAGFNTGALRVDDNGTERTVAVGRLTVGDGHADLSLSAHDAKAVYDDPAKAWAWVQASDDAFGTQVNGVVIPGTPDSRVTQALAHPASGDWRPINGKRELVAACCVNTAGIPIPRQLVASGQEGALVAAGAVAPNPANPQVQGASIADAVLVQLGERLPDFLRQFGERFSASRDGTLAERQAAALAELERDELLAELGVDPVTGFDPDSLTDDEVAHLVETFAPRTASEVEPIMVQGDDMPLHTWSVETLANWVEKAGGLPPYIKRIAKHLQQKGKDQSQAIATAVNVVKKMCATGDINFPGKQQVNAGSQAEACKAVADWERKKAQ